MRSEVFFRERVSLIDNNNEGVPYVINEEAATLCPEGFIPPVEGETLGSRGEAIGGGWGGQRPVTLAQLVRAFRC